MGSLCHFYGLELSKMKERDSTKRDVMSPYETLTISPTTSLSSCDSCASSCSEFSVDLNPYYRSNQEEGTMPNSREDSSCRVEEHKDSIVEATSCGVGGSNMAMESNFKEFNRGHKHNSTDVEIRQANHLHEANNNSVENESRIVNGVTNNGNSSGFCDEIESKVWDPPEAEDPEDDMQGGMAYDDDDECGDGTKWGSSSSLSNFRDEGSGSYRFKEEKQKALDEVINGTFKALVTQLLRSFGVAPTMEGGESWADIITSLSWEAAFLLKPDAVDGKGIGPDGYVKIKCIATGTRRQSQVIKGLVFKKHAAHKHMPTDYKNPKLLLIRGVLGQSLSSLSSFNAMKQEDYLKPVVEMIEVSHPNVILVEKSVSRDIQESILAKGMTLVFDMKLHRLERIARCTGSSIVSTDTVAIPKLKQCESFRIEKFVEEHAGFVEGEKKPIKTLMFLEGCPTRLGCTILLKGSHSDELKKIKSIVQCSVGVAYHLILETAFLVDQRAMFSTIPLAGIADSSQNDQSSPTSVSSGIHDPSFGHAAPDHSSCAIDIPILNGFLGGDSYHVKSELGESSPFSCEPYNPLVFSGFSSLSASLKKVIGDNFPLASSYPSLSSYFGFTRKEPNGHVESPTSLSASSDAVAIKDCLDDTKSPDEGENQSLLTSSEVLPESVEDAHGSDPKEKKMLIDTQSILVLMSRRNALGNVCEQSHFSRITFYKNFDVPIGKFLQDKILNRRSQCTACGGLPEAHFYYYAHHNEQLTIRVKGLPNDKQLPGEGQGKLWMWSRCGKCKPFNGSTRSTKRVLMSTAARCLSFGKFLELSFSHHSSFARLANCGHSLQRDFVYFFGLGPVVAMFRYSPVTTYTISMPPRKLEFSTSIRSEWFAKEIKEVYTKGMLLFAEVGGTLKKIGPQFAGSVLHQIDSPKAFSDIEEMLKQESHDFELSIQNVAKNENPGQNAYKMLCLNRLLWELLLESFIWDRRLHYLLSADPPKAAAVSSGKAAQQPESNMDGAAGRGNGGTDLGANDFSVREVPIKEPLEVEKEFSVKDIPIESPIREHEQDPSKVITASEDLHGAMADNLSYQQISSDQNLLSRSDILSYDHSGKAENQSSPDHSNVDRTIQNSMGLLKPSFVSFRGNRGLTSQSSLFSTRQSVNGWFWKPFAEIKELYMNELLRGYSPRFEFVGSQTSEYLVTTHQLISEEGSRLHIPFANDNYILSDYEGELSSIIACALALLNDQPAMTDLITDDSRSDSWVASKAAENMQNPIRVPSSTCSLSSNGWLDSDSVHSMRSTFSAESRLSSFDGLDSPLPSENFKAEVSLGVTKSLAKGKYSVVCLYANEFRDLRSLCCLSEVDFIASLSRCRNWDAKGGKSKSIFAKTLDDRFIIKEIKKAELYSFEKFAPHYFKHMKQSFESGNQTCLAKIFGIYQVTLRQNKSGKEARHDLMVMENLTFCRNITRQYDLKGALHDRFNSATDGAGVVLLDQNFVKDMNSSPLYVSNNAKKLLQRAVWNDTSFLNSINVMDYSLLVVVDQQKQELVCGIIDYLRQYTWDKQLETWVKSSLYLPKNQSPTVISPKEYKKRFRKFMSAYFLCVPDNWCSQGSTDSCEICTTNDDSSNSESRCEGT